MKAGKLKDKIAFLKPTDLINDKGVPYSNYTLYKSVWADWKVTSVKEYIENKKNNIQIEAVVETRYMSGIESDMLIRYQSKDYEITSIIDVKNEHKKLNIIVKRSE